MKYLLQFIALLTVSIASLAQDDVPAIYKERKTAPISGYSYTESTWYYTPSATFAKGTKNNFGIEVEYGASDLIGLVAGIGTSSFGDTTVAYLNKLGIYKTSFTGLSFGLRGHSGSFAKAKRLDIMPGIFWAKFFDPDQILQDSNQLYGAIEIRYFISAHVGINLGASIAFIKDSDPSFGVGIVFR